MAFDKLSKVGFVREPFYILTITLLSLLLPLSFLLLSRLCRAQYILTSLSTQSDYSLLISLFLYTNPILLQVLVSLVSVTALLHGLTAARVTLIPDRLITSPDRSILQTHLNTAWVLICTLQVCVGLGIEGTISAGIWNHMDDENSFATNIWFPIRLIFIVGLHETMAQWSTTFVRPVVDDTVFGGPRDGYWLEKFTLAASFGALWWWRLRDEVEGLVWPVETKTDFRMSDMVSWWLYYLTVTIGAVKFGRGFMWFWKLVLCTTPEKRDLVNDEKV